MCFRSSIFLLPLLFGTLLPAEEAPLATEADFLAIQKLSKREADKHYPITLVGVVAHVFPWQDTFTFATLDDPCGRALYVKCDAVNQLKTKRTGWKKLQTGMVIQLEGFTYAYRYAPAIHASAITALRRMEMPPLLLGAWPI